jgi:hypothetical protein
VAGDVDARLAKAGAGDADAIAELRAAERYADSGHRTELAVPRENAGVSNPDIDAHFRDTNAPANAPVKVEVKARTARPMSRNSLTEDIDRANRQIKDADPTGPRRGDIVVDAGDAPPRMSRADVEKVLRNKMHGDPTDPAARLRSIDYLEVVYRDPADGGLKRSFLVRTADGQVNGPFTEWFRGL